MKKMYKQPVVEQMEIRGGFVMSTASPVGIGSGGTTGGISGGGSSIPAE